MSDYFGEASASRGGNVGSFATVDDQPEIEPAPGVRIRAVAGLGVMLS